MRKHSASPDHARPNPTLITKWPNLQLKSMHTSVDEPRHVCAVTKQEHDKILSVSGSVEERASGAEMLVRGERDRG